MKTELSFKDKTIEINNILKEGEDSTLELYFCFPSNWGINEENMIAENFFRSMRSRVSYYTSKVKHAALASLAKEDDKHHHYLFAHQYRQYLKKGVKLEKGTEAMQFIENCKKTLDLYRERTDFNDPIAVMVDDVCSWQSEQFWLKLGKRFPEVIPHVREEQAYRKHRKYIVDTYKDNAVNTLRLKRSFLEDRVTARLNISQLGGVRTQMAFSIAAFISMVGAMGLAFGGQILWGNLSTNFFILMCVGYIFKDRFKEIFRNTLIKRLSAGKPQRKVDYTIGGKRVATATEMFEYSDREIKVTELHARHIKFHTLHFCKQYKVDSNNFVGYRRLRDSIRFDFGKVLSRTPKSNVMVQRLVGNRVKEEKAKVTYYMRVYWKKPDGSFEGQKLKVVNGKIVRATTAKSFLRTK